MTPTCYHGYPAADCAWCEAEDTKNYGPARRDLKGEPLRRSPPPPRPISVVPASDPTVIGPLLREHQAAPAPAGAPQVFPIMGGETFPEACAAVKARPGDPWVVAWTIGWVTASNGNPPREGVGSEDYRFGYWLYLLGTSLRHIQSVGELSLA